MKITYMSDIFKLIEEDKPESFSKSVNKALDEGYQIINSGNYVQSGLKPKNIYFVHLIKGE